MHINALAAGSLLSALALAAPRPQDIDFDMVIAAPNPTYTTTLSQVTYDATAILSSAMPQITSSMTSDADAASSDAPNKVKRTACQVQPTGAGPMPPTDTPSAFLSYSAYAAAASAAAVPAGYSQTFKNMQASNNAYGYMGYTLLSSYDVATCAKKCNAINGCMSINIYYERDPTVEPADGCPNPPSTTNIKCVFWGGPVSSDNALNVGQYRDQFQVVIAGSNGYVNNSIATPPGYTAATALGNAAINAPYDKFGYNSYMGSAIFTSGPFNAQLCADACSAKSAYAVAHPPTDGSPVQTCQFFNTYILYVNTTANLQGQYCAMYSESWDASYATNKGQYRGNDHYLIEYSYTYSNATNPGAASPNGAVHQASKDISYSTLQPFCSSLLGYTIPVTTTTATSTSTPLGTVTTTVATVTVAAGGASKRAAALSTPNVLTKYPSAIISSACSLQATPVTSTSVSTVMTTTTVPTVFATVSATSTTTAAAYSPPSCARGQALGNFAIQASYNGQYAEGGQGESSVVSFDSPLSGAQAFYLDANCVLVEATGAYAMFQAEQDTGAYRYGEEVFFASTSRINDEGFLPVTCAVDSNNGLFCAVQGNAYNAQYSDLWLLYDNASDAASDGSSGISVTAVPV